MMVNNINTHTENTILQRNNDQVEFKWIQLGLAAKWANAVKPALRLASVQVVDGGVAHLGFASGF